MIRLYSKREFLALAAAVFPALLHAAAAPPVNLSLSNAPLSVSSVVEPNVMLLIDTSGSMNHIIWDDGFFDIDVNAQFQWQSRYNGGWRDSLGNTTSSWYQLKSLYSFNCANGAKAFRNPNNSSDIRCLRLPDPLGGGNTWYAPAYLNYLVNTYGSADLTGGTIPNETRMQSAKDVARELIDKSLGVRFGISRFYRNSNFSNAHGATIDGYCGDSSKDEIKASLATYNASASTPLAEALYEITRYFRGMSSFYHNDLTYSSPIEYRCQKNFTIAITDGFPTRDSYFDVNDPDIPSGMSLPDWDGKHPTTTADQYPDFPEFSDGYEPNGSNNGSEGATLYLDDIAKFAWDIDFKKSGNDAAGIPYNDAAFPVQNMSTYTVGFATQNTMLENAAEGEPDDAVNAHDYGHGAYYTANNSAELAASLASALDDIIKKSGSSSSAAASTGRVQAGSRVFQARFNSADWTGELLAYDIESDPTKPNYGDLKTDLSGKPIVAFDAGLKIPAWGARNIFTNKSNLGVPFRWNQFTSGVSGERTAYFDNDQAMLQYLRGRNTSDANRDVSIYRKRSQDSGVYRNLGDIVHSSPYYVGPPSARYTDAFEAKKYSDFEAAYKSRTPIIYVGANDGMLHGFDAQTGEEKIAFIPGSLLPKLKELTAPDYSHQYYVDGSPTVVDAFDSTNQKWRTVLVGGLNRGGQSIYAIDVTDPSAFSESNASSLFLWEFTDVNDADLGYTYSRPKVIKMHDGKWYAVFGNGYNNTENDGNVSTTGDAAIYIVDLWTGSLLKKITVGTGASKDPTTSNRPNGFATITPVDITGDNVVDYIYGGDLFGNVWKFDVSDADTSKWELDYRLFTACSGVSCNGSNTQPITTPVTVGRSKNGIGHMVYFGSGKYLETTDNNGAAGGVQSFYGIWDKGATVAGRSALLEQSIISEVPISVINKNGTPDDTSDDFQEIVPLRKTSNNYASTSNLGWYIDLVPPGNNSERGERLVSAPVLRGDRIIFVTSIPADDPCSPSGDSWIMTMDALNGGRLNHTYDIDKDRSFGQGDKRFTEGGDPVVATGIKVASGGNSPSFMPGADVDKVIISGTDKIDIVDLYEGDNVNRQSWQQISR